MIFPKEKGEFIFPIADGRIKTLRGDQDLTTSTLVRHRPIQGESNIDFLGESEGSLPQPQDSFPDAGEAINDFWSMSDRHRVEPRPDHLWPELWKSMGKHAKLKEKQKWAEEKIHLDNARKLRGIYFIDPKDKEFKETIKNARKKLGKHQWLLLCLVKL